MWRRSDGTRRGERRRPGRGTLAAQRLRPLPLLPERLGDPVRRAEEHRYSVAGGFAEYVLADPDFVGHLPDGLEFAPAAPILCAGVTVYKGSRKPTPGPVTRW